MSKQRLPSAGYLRTLLIPFVVLIGLLFGCSAADLVQRNEPTATPTPMRTPAPTFTPTPEDEVSIIIVTPPALGTPGVIIVPEGVDPRSVIPIPTDTPTPTETATVPFTETAPGVAETVQSPVEVTPSEPPTETPVPPTSTPTETATSTPTFTPTATSTPFIVVKSGLVNLRQGPGVQYPLVAQLGTDIPVAIIGQNPEGTWYQICCVSGEAVWVAKSHVTVGNDASSIALFTSDPPPTVTPTGTPTITPIPSATPTATLYPFDRARGPEFYETNNEFLTIWANIHVQPDPQKTPDPARGYYLMVLFEGFERPATNGMTESAGAFLESAARGAGNRVFFNYKYEYTPPDPKKLDCNSLPPTLSPSCLNGQLTRKDLLGTGVWSVFVVDGAGNQLSDEVTFTTAPSNPRREVYIAWNRVR